MSTILTTRVRNHIDASVAEFIDLTDAPGDEGKLYSRGITAIALSGLSGVAYKDISKYIVDGGSDNGIDGVYYDQNKNRLYIVQAKWSTKGTGTIGTGDLRKFISGVYDLLNEDWSKFNKKVSKIAADLSQAIKNDPTITLVVTFNSDQPISDECTRIIEEFLDDNNTDSQELVTFHTFGLKRIIRTINIVKTGARTDVDINLLQWGEQKEPYYSIYGKVSCADVAEWHKEHGIVLFSENIRNTLPDSEINAHIEHALLNNPSEFWYLNNGITAISDEIVRKPVGLGDQKESAFWKVSNLKIVNGAQTTGTIAKAYEKAQNQVKKAYVQIKIISLEKAPIDIANKITTATNTQNKVEPKDFLALDAIQDGIAEGFKKIGVQYCFRRGDKVKDAEKGLEVQELAIVLAVSSDSMNNVTIAKRNVGSLTDPNGHYKKIFDAKLKIDNTWTLIKKWRAASEEVSKLAIKLGGRDAQIAVHGNRFIEHMLVTEGKPINATETEEIYNKLKTAIDELYSDCYLAVLFKNAKKCDSLKSKILSYKI